MDEKKTYTYQFSIVGLRYYGYKHITDKDSLRCLVGQRVVLRRVFYDIMYPDKVVVTLNGKELGCVREQNLNETVNSLMVQNREAPMTAWVTGVDEIYSTLIAEVKTSFKAYKTDHAKEAEEYNKFTYSEFTVNPPKGLLCLKNGLADLLTMLNEGSTHDQQMASTIDNVCENMTYCLSKEIHELRISVMEFLNHHKDKEPYASIRKRLADAIAFRNDRKKRCDNIMRIIDEMAADNTLDFVFHHMLMSGMTRVDMERQLAKFPHHVYEMWLSDKELFCSAISRKDLPLLPLIGLLSGIVMMRMFDAEAKQTGADEPKEERMFSFRRLVECTHDCIKQDRRAYEILLRRAMNGNVTEDDERLLANIGQQSEENRKKTSPRAVYLYGDHATYNENNTSEAVCEPLYVRSESSKNK